jgi:hypothetical protein
MSFNKKTCQVPEIWCGDDDDLPSGYTKVGSRVECLRRGFGAGKYSEIRKNLPANSLQQIKYVGEKFEKSFIAIGIKNLTQLKKEMGSKTSSQIKTIISKIATKKDGAMDVRAFNSIILYLYENGIGNVPQCIKMV